MYKTASVGELKDADITQATWTQACEKGCFAGLKLGGAKATDTPLPPPIAASRIFGGDFVAPGQSAAGVSRVLYPH